MTSQFHIGFENWIHDEYPELSLERQSGGTYYDSIVQKMWDAWFNGVKWIDSEGLS